MRCHTPLCVAGRRVSAVLHAERVGEHVFGVDPGLTLVCRRVAVALCGLQSFFCCRYPVLLPLPQNLICRDVTFISIVLYTIQNVSMQLYINTFLSTERISRLSVFQWCTVGVFLQSMTLLKEYWTSGSKHGVMYVSWCMCKITWSSSIKQHIHQNCLTLLNEMSIQ